MSNVHSFRDQAHRLQCLGDAIQGNLARMDEAEVYIFARLKGADYSAERVKFRRDQFATACKRYNLFMQEAVEAGLDVSKLTHPENKEQEITAINNRLEYFAQRAARNA